ncbi:hypothetical protein VP1G_02258 [Cytospora mali]|uniref:Uncharacterized protein n=1 Tax=Cytospora mali TaxID=578113 RepID=A0A194UT45_CYTMA|nr:hypothetical protein VP1G_02258 [Valsa mali var. pyri (nom. inval.)]
MLGRSPRLRSAWAVRSTPVATRVKHPFQSECSFRRHPRHLVLNILVINILLMMVAVQASASETPLLPYIPTTILIPGSAAGVAFGQGTVDAKSTAYIFTPSSDDGSVDLLSLNISTAVNSSSISNSAKTLTSGLPFLSSNTTTFTPTLAADGSIIVYAGDCFSDTGSSVWVYNTTSSDQSSWMQHSVAESAATGPYLLGGGISYSETISPTLSQPLIYAYGGQCPNASLDGTTWTSAADYSNTMIRLTPSEDSSSSMDYTAETLPLKSKPVAEAGFSLTSLPPSTSNISGIVTQSINSVVLGGHTQSAFVNMSTAAVWSLPEESWSFVSINGPSASSSSDTSELAKNDGEITSVQPRSGHTAILNEGGTVLVILGGWVGNTSQAAQPQLAVLEMSDSEFGQWTWSVPDNQPLSDGEGIYGHGAALLPGDIMMVAGGYAISSSSSGSSGSSLGRRDDIGVAGGQLQMFFNITSQTWSNSYTNPLSTSTGTGSGSTTSSLSYYARLGLGLGLGLGIPALFILLAVCFFCYRRRQRHRHSVRGKNARSLTTSAAFITSDEMLEREHEHGYPWGPHGATRWYYTGGHDPYLRDEGRALGYESLRGPGGAHPDFDDPMSGEPVGGYRRDARRKSAPRVARGLYQPTGVDGMDDGPGAIHPILEDEEDEVALPGAISPDRDEGTDDNPFNTMSPPIPTTAAPGPGGAVLSVYSETPVSGPPSPTETRTPVRVQSQHRDVQDWVSEIDASGALITARLQPRSTTIRSVGRVSPTHRQSIRAIEDEGAAGAGARTDSNLSDSNRSTFSFIMNRSDSIRLAAAAGAGWLGAGKSRNEQERGGTSHSDNSNSGNSGNSEGTQGSYTTAKSIPALQSEGPGLLLGRPRPISGIEDLGHISDDDPLTPGSPSKSKPPRRSWFGSLKRVFSSGTGSSNESSNRTESPTHGQSSDFEGLGLGSLGLGGIGLLQKRKQGRSAWGGEGPSGSGGVQGTGEGWEEEGEDWDIEKAVENRLVQVMFSVPKDRLRVVNADADLVSLEESVVVVDPEKDEIQPSPVSATQEAVAGKGKGKEVTKEKEAEEASDDVASQSEEVGKGRELSKQQGKQAERQSLLLEVPQRPGSEYSEGSRRRSLSPVVMTAEAIKFERPRTRVLEMVEGFEEKSRSNSPVGKASSFSSKSSR